MATQELNSTGGAVPVHLRPRPSDQTYTPDYGTEVAPCLAPAMMLYLDPHGDVRPCCKNHVALGNVTRTRLTDIWWGRSREFLEQSVNSGDYSLGCTQCGVEIVAEGRDIAYPSNYDRYAPLMEADRSQRWPLRMEFNLSNSCNLQCIQCNGLLSSSIRLHREGRPPLPKVYDDRFFEDLEAFIPHLVDAQFAGGEPFMAAETYRVWDMIKRLNPDLYCMTVTNATQWNKRVRSVIEDLAMGFVFSLDGVTKKTYEAVRVGADFKSVMTNVKRYSEIAKRNGYPLEVNYCQMVQNYQGLPDVLRWGEERDMHVNVCVVRHPLSCSLAAADDETLRGALRLYEKVYDRVASDLALNLPAWEREVTRIRRWVEAGTTGRVELAAERDHFAEVRHTRALRILQQLTVGERGRPTGEAKLDEDGRVLDADAGFADLAGTTPENLVGLKVEEQFVALIETHLDSPIEVAPVIGDDYYKEFDVSVDGRRLRVLLWPALDPDAPLCNTVTILESNEDEVGTPFIDPTSM